MATLHTDVLDNGLSVLNSATTTIHITSQEATANSGANLYSLGSASISIGAPTTRYDSNNAQDGRKVVAPSITGASVATSGTASHYAIVDSTRLLATGSLTGGGQAVTSGNTFSLATFDIGIPDPA